MSILKPHCGTYIYTGTNTRLAEVNPIYIYLYIDYPGGDMAIADFRWKVTAINITHAYMP